MSELETQRLYAKLRQSLFNAQTVRCVRRPGDDLRQFRVFVDGDSLLFDISSIDGGEKQVLDDIHRYPVRYSVMGWTAYFGSVNRIECLYGDRGSMNTRLTISDATDDGVFQRTRGTGSTLLVQ